MFLFEVIILCAACSLYSFHALCRLLEEKRKELGDAASKLRNGLLKLDETREKVQVMRVELEEKTKQV